MKTLEEIEKYAKENYVPIARRPLVEFLLNMMEEKNYHSFLEIGTAIGYTALQIASLKDVYVTTFEYYEPRIKVAKENFKDFQVEDKINFITGNALDFDLKEKFDVIFIDGAKAKNILFFEKFAPLLNDDGVIIIDNIDLAVINTFEKERKKRYYRNKIAELKEYMKNLQGYIVEYKPIGDGIYYISKK